MFEDERHDREKVLVQRFERMLEEEQVLFFDVDEFEAITDHYLSWGKMQQAMKAAELAIQQHPGESNFKLTRVNILVATNKLREAEQELNSLSDRIAAPYELFVARANLASRQNNYSKAIAFLKKALKHGDTDEVYYLIGLEYQKMGNYEMAIKYFKMSLDQGYDLEDTMIYNIANCFDLLNKNEDSIDFFKAAIEEDPYYDLLWYHLALAYVKLKEYDQALWAVDYAILCEEDFLAAYYEKARILERTYRFEEAAEVYKESLRIEPENGYTYYKIGLCYYDLHKMDKAISYLVKAVHEDPQLDEAHFDLAILYDERDMHQEAVHHINKAFELDEDNWEYQEMAASIHHRAGLLDEAEQLYQSLIDKGFSEQSIFMDFTELLFDLHQFEEGMTVMYKGLQLNPKSTELNYRMAGYLFSLGENDEALIYFKKAYKKDAAYLQLFFEIFPKLKNHEVLRAYLAGLRK